MSALAFAALYSLAAPAREHEVANALSVTLDALEMEEAAQYCPAGCHLKSQMHGDPMFKVNGQGVHFWIKEGSFQQLMAWTDDHLMRHRTFVYTVLTAVHDDGSHTGEGQINWIAHLAGARELRVSLGEHLGIRVGAEHAALVNASRRFNTLP